MILRGLLIITILIVLPLESYALAPFYSFRHLYEQSNDSPSPSPSNGVDLASGAEFQHSCNRASRSCQLKNIAACLTYSRNGSHEEGFLLVQNNLKAPLHVKIMILPANNTIKEIDLPSHQMEKIKISLEVELSSAIALNTRDGDCVIQAAARAPAPENHFQKYPSYSTYITPQNGVYLVILLVIVGGTLTCFKSRIRARHLDGVPYHELEMGNSPALSSLDLEESEVENWDQDWDDEWGDEKPVKSGGENPVMVKQANGLTTKLPNSNGRRKEWDD